MSTREADIRAIRQLAAAWRAAWLAGDVTAIMSLYDDDPVLMPQDQPLVAGKDAIRSLYQAVLPEYDVASDSTVREVEAAGDWGYFWSTYTLTATPKAGGRPTECAGKSVFIVRRNSDGDWKIARLIDNSDGAPTDHDLA